MFANFTEILFVSFLRRNMREDLRIQGLITLGLRGCGGKFIVAFPLIYVCALACSYVWFCRVLPLGFLPYKKHELLMVWICFERKLLEYLGCGVSVGVFCFYVVFVLCLFFSLRRCLKRRQLFLSAYIIYCSSIGLNPEEVIIKVNVKFYFLH